jgi:hypothetical protein
VTTLSPAVDELLEFDLPVDPCVTPLGEELVGVRRRRGSLDVSTQIPDVRMNSGDRWPVIRD